MEEIQFLEKIYSIFLKDPSSFILFGSLCVNVYLFKEYVSLLKDNVDISKKLTIIMSNFEIDDGIKIVSSSKNKTLELVEEQKNVNRNNESSNIKKPE